MNERSDFEQIVEDISSSVGADQRAELRALVRTWHIQCGELDTAKQTARDAERKLSDALACMSRLHGRELYARRQALEARQEVARIQRSFSYRLGKVLVQHGRSPLGWIKLPLAIVRELIGHRRRWSLAASAAAAEGMASAITVTDERSTWLPLSGKPQVIRASSVESGWDLWATVLSANDRKRVTLTVQVAHADEPSVRETNTVDQLQRHRDLVIRRLKAVPGVPFRLIEGAAGELSLRLVRKSGSFCALNITLQPAGGGQPEPEQASVRNSSATGLPSPRITSMASRGDTATDDATDLQNVFSDSLPTESRIPGQSQADGGKQFSASELEAKLWGGFARYAIPALEQLKADTLAPVTERRKAAWSLTRWFYVEEEYERALENIGFERRLSDAPQAHFLLAEGQCLVKLKRWEAADAVLRSGALQDARPDFQLLRSTAVRYRELERSGSRDEAEMAQLNLLNELYVSAGLATLKKIRSDHPLHLSNVTAVAQPRRSQQHLKVSIIIPAYNAASTIGWVIASLLQQTWRNLEVVVVDDCSRDDTCGIVEAIGRHDSRVKLVRAADNGGAYGARNIGLRHVTGELITVHDSDDWSHPQRIELQIELLESNPSVIATKSHWIRVSEHLDVIGAWIPKGTVIDLNFSSLLFRKELLGVLGTWDDVLVSGDAEFYARLKQLYGSDAVMKVPRNKILAFSLTRDDSLTRSKATHLRSLYYGLRGNYRDAYQYWHSQLSADSEDLPFDPAAARHRFPVPPRNRPPGKQTNGNYDVIVISDFAMRGGAFVSALNYVIAACKAGKKTAVFHWRRFDLAADAGRQPRLYETCREFDIDILGPGDTVEADFVLIGYPTILQHRIEPMPEILARNLVIIVNQFASRLVGGGDQQYDPVVVRKHLASIFGTEGVWVPISNWVRRLLEQDSRYPAPYSKPWYPMIDVESWYRPVAPWRGAERRRPVVGRHGRDTYTKWPSDPDVLAQAYGVGQEWEVRFLGGAECAIRTLGGRPGNWSAIPFDEVPVEDFLRDLDFYVHYPHEQYIEEFGRGVMEAMVLGIPVILPPQFAETFGDAAIYASAGDVPEIVSKLWQSRDKYLERAEAGRRFVVENCSLSCLPDRLSDLMEAMDGNAAGYGSSGVDLAATIRQ